jgi:hypothetical protein
MYKLTATMADSPVTDACVNRGRSKPIDQSVNFYYTNKKAILLLRRSLYYAQSEIARHLMWLETVSSKYRCL